MNLCLIQRGNKMPDVDSCIREAETGLCSDCAEHAKRIAEIPDKQRAMVFRQKSGETIVEILQKCSNSIKTDIIKRFYKDDNKISIIDIELIPGAKNNRDGADLVHKLPNGKLISIEVKFGAKTDKNIGMKIFEKIFGSKVFRTALSLKNRRLWFKAFCDDNDGNNENKQFIRLFDALNNAVSEFNKEQKNKNFKLTRQEQEFMEKEILNASGSSDFARKYDYYLKYVLNDNEDFIPLPCLDTGVGNWIVDTVKEISGKVKRVNVFVKNDTTNIQLRFTLNWKNNYHRNGKTFAAKLGFCSPNWNVWIINAE